MTTFAVRLEVLKAMLANASWKARLDKAKSVAEMQAVIVEFCRYTGWQVAEV